jgi:hypothetical protein
VVAERLDQLALRHPRAALDAELVVAERFDQPVHRHPRAMPS